MQVIFHCDDIGFTLKSTIRILEAWRGGLIDGFSILANGEALAEVISALTQCEDRHARISVHLNLSEGRARYSHKEVPFLTHPKGNFRCSFTGLLRTWLTGSEQIRDSLCEQIEKEWRAQISTVLEVCRPRTVTALDGHHHIHMLPFLFPIAARLAREHGIPEIRIAREPFYISSDYRDTTSLEFVLNIVKHVVLRSFSGKACRVARDYGLSSPDFLVGVLYTGRMSCAAARAGIRASGRRKARSVEVLFHIGRSSREELNCSDIRSKLTEFHLSGRRSSEYRELIRLRKED
jgi:predicted glycoside hydrolase/deacetylase ChbG (UPF0249 family)